MLWGSIILGLNAGLVIFTSHRLFQLLFSGEDPGRVNQVLLLSLTSIGQIVLVAMCLGYAGFFSKYGFLACHVIFAGVVFQFPLPRQPTVIPIANTM